MRTLTKSFPFVFASAVTVPELRRQRKVPAETSSPAAAVADAAHENLFAVQLNRVLT